MNHFAHSEATKMAKGVEATLKVKLDDMELTVSKQEAELKQYVILHPTTITWLIVVRQTSTSCLINLMYAANAALFTASPLYPKSTRMSSSSSRA